MSDIIKMIMNSCIELDKRDPVVKYFKLFQEIII